MKDYARIAHENFKKGYNCAQAVSVAFCDVTGLSQAQAAKMAAPFGGGFGRQREVCGAVSGMCMVYGILYGYEVPNADNQLDVYADVQAMCAQFREKAGSIVCRDILKNPPSDPNPSPRTAEYYAKRPCARMVMTAARILDEYIAAHPVA